MNILCADDERLALEALTGALGKALPAENIFAFRSGQEALALAEETPIDVAFLDIDMREMSGLELAARLKELRGKTNIVFVTGYEDYALDAFGVSASGYLMKPVTAEEILEAMKHLRDPVPMRDSGRLRVQCFGRFEVFANGRPVEFFRSKSKELLAYLVDRCGAGCSTTELAAALWEDGEYNTSRKNQMQNYLSELRRALSSVGAQAALLHPQHNSYDLDTSLVDCDLYCCLNGDPGAINRYQGEYMSQYAWAEFTAGMLTNKLL